MKVSPALRAEYEVQRAVNFLLKEKVDVLLTGKKPSNWHFESRLKGLVSYALKIETGRFNPRELEDFYACTLVVPNLASTARAESVVSDLFDVQQRKPAVDDVVWYDATNFIFDQTRIYCKLPPPPGLDRQPIHTLVFEVQIKTFLDHAWSIATHDLTYKTSKVSWGKERVAAQVKASLEAAEVSILEAETLAGSDNPLLKRRNQHTAELLKIIETIESELADHDLPDDMKRLAESIHCVFRLCRQPVGDLADILREGMTHRGGSHPVGLSPYSVVVQYLLTVRQEETVRALRKTGGRERVYVANEVELPASVNIRSLPRVLTVDAI